MLSNLLPKTRLDNKLHKTTRPNRKGLNQAASKPTNNYNASTATNSRANIGTSASSVSQSRQTNQSTTFNRAGTNTAKPAAILNKQTVSPRNSSAFKTGAPNLHTSKDPVSISPTRPTSQGATRPETNYGVPTGEIGAPGQAPGYLAMNYISQ